MALVLADRIKETTTTTGTGTITLGGAQTGFESFAGIGDGNTTYYVIQHTSANEFEVGLGTYTSSGTTLSRDTIYTSSNSDAAVNFSAGTKIVFVAVPTEATVYEDASNNVTVGGKITVASGPTAQLDVATKAYVDAATAASIHIHDAVRVEREGNLNATYNNGTAGVGATLTNAGTQAALVIDGVTLNTNDRVLVYEQTDATENGVYVVTDTGSVSTNWVLTRSSDANTSGENDANSLDEGSYFYVQEGTEGAGESYVCNVSGAITFGTTNITFAQFAATPEFTGGTNIDITGQTISLTGTVDETNGGTGNNAYTTGDTLYASATNTLAKLSGNTTTTKKYLSQTGDGASSAAPAWDEINLGTDTTGNYIAAVSAGNAGIDVSGSGEGATASVSLDLSELSTSTTDGDGDFFVVVDSSDVQRKLTKGNINNSGFNNDAGFITSADGGNAATLDSLDSTQFLRSDAADTKTSGDLSFLGNVKATFGASADLQIYHDGSNSYIEDTGTGTLYIDGTALVLRDNSTGDTAISITNNSNEPKVQLRYNNNARLDTTSTGVDITGNATFDDNGKAIFGAGSDLQIYHDGTSSVIHDNGTGNLSIRATNLALNNAGNSASYLLGNAGAEVSLYYNGAKKFETTSTGIDVTGNATFDDNGKAIFGAGSDLQVYHDGTDSHVVTTNGDLNLQVAGGGSINLGDQFGNTLLQVVDNVNVKLYFGSTPAQKLSTTNTGISVTGSVTASSDLRLKDNVERITDAISKVNELDGVTFDWKDGTGASAGVIAQQVLGVMPASVDTSDAEHLRVNYDSLIGLLIEAVKEQQESIEKLKSRVAELEA